MFELSGFERLHLDHAQPTYRSKSSQSVTIELTTYVGQKKAISEKATTYVGQIKKKAKAFLTRNPRIVLEDHWKTIS